MQKQPLLSVISVFLFLLTLIITSCSSKTAKVDADKGGLEGVLVPKKADVSLFLCRVDDNAENCTLQTQLADTTGKNGTFAISLISPGSYVVFYADQTEVSMLEPKTGDLMTTSFSDTDYLLEKVGNVELGGVNVDGTARLSSVDARIKHKHYGLRTEIQNNKLVKIKIEANKVTQAKVNLWP